MPEDASATYRGFRNQALYVLHRLLTDGDREERIYRPEGAEDLAVFDSQMSLVEVVQVKDYSGDLAVSHFKPKSDRGFFARLHSRMQEHPGCITKLASFGSLGPELDGAISGDAKHREIVVEKLCSSNASISAAAATAMLDGLKGNIVHPIEAELLASIVEALQGTNVAAEINSSVELLMYWIFSASEKQRDLTWKGLLSQLERIGGYLAALRDTSAEWGVSVAPVKTLVLTPDDSARLVGEYRRGVQARWEHVVAGADCLRAGRLREIHGQFEHRSVVIIRGASGQGKSTLGWRYLHDFCAGGLRFHLRLVGGREHALRVASALSTHVRRLNLKAVAYLDVSPADAGWSDLVRELVAAGLKVLIAVREEDFRRANIAIGDFDYSEVVLDRVTKDEAETIFSTLKLDSKVSALDFEEVWARFASEEGGPLLEFTHLVSEGESLTSRIATQIRRIQNDAVAKVNGLTEAHLELLALAAIANETGARVSQSELCGAVGINLVTGPFKVLENEYLLRAQDESGDAFVAGLHALRSKAVVSALFADTSGLWEKYAIKVLPLIVDEYIESFLLAAFSRRPGSADVLLEKLRKLVPRTWTHAGCIARSLLWEGVSRYEIRNRDTILAAIAKYDAGWSMVCDSFVGLDDDASRELLETINDVFTVRIEPIKLTPKSEVFDLLADWARDAPAPLPPERPSEWTSAGDIAHWLGHMGVNGPLRTAIEKLLPKPLPADLRIEELGRFVSGRERLGDATFYAWHDEERGNITEAFLRESDSDYVADDGSEVKVFFSVSLADSVTSGVPDAHDWDGQTMKRVRLLRLLFPHREKFGAQGMGLEVLVEQMGYDPTCKQVSAKALPLERSVRVNAIFQSIVSFRHRRPDTWKEYASAVLEFRQAVSECLRKLHKGWAKLLSEPTPRPNTIKQLPGAEIERLNRLSNLPMFPRSAVDEWGFLSEEKNRNATAVATMQEAALRRFDGWRKAFSRFESGVGMVASKAIEVTVVYLAECKGHVPKEGEREAGRLSLINLTSAWEALRTMQSEFRARFGGLVEPLRLDELEAHERSNLRHMWVSSFAMQHQRRQHGLSPTELVEGGMELRRARFLASIRTEVSASLGDSGTATVRNDPWVFDDISHLCIVCDHHSLRDVDAVLPKVIEGLWRAAQPGNWRPLEWKPLEVEWPKIAIVHLFRGKALLPASATISSGVLFGSADSFDVKPFHYTPLPMRLEDFANGGFSLWESPLLRAAVMLQANVVAFALTCHRFGPLVKLALQHGLNQTDADRILARFNRELTIVLTIAQQSFWDLVRILDASEVPDKTQWTEELHKLCRFLLFEVDEDATARINLDTFESWLEGFNPANLDFQALMSRVAEFAISS